MALLLKVAGQRLAHLAAAAGQDNTQWAQGARSQISYRLHGFRVQRWQ
jgi:hypothetical protein